MTKIWVGIQFEGPTEPEELFACIEVALVEYKRRQLPFATTAEDEPITVSAWRDEWISE
jgi:hypothetical protein